MYEKLLELYKRKGCTKEQLQRYVNLDKITKQEYNKIVSEVDNA